MSCWVNVCVCFLPFSWKISYYAGWGTPVLGQFYVLLLGLTFSVFTLKSSSSLAQVFLHIYTSMMGLKTLGDQSLISVFPDKQYSSFWPRNGGCLLGFPVSLWNIVGVPLISPYLWVGGNRYLFSLVSLSQGIIKPLSQRLGKVRQVTTENVRIMHLSRNVRSQRPKDIKSKHFKDSENQYKHQNAFKTPKANKMLTRMPLEIQNQASQPTNQPTKPNICTKMFSKQTN